MLNVRVVTRMATVKKPKPRRNDNDIQHTRLQILRLSSTCQVFEQPANLARAVGEDIVSCRRCKNSS